MKRHPKTPPTGQQLKAVIKRQPAVFTVYMVLRLIVLATLVSSILRGEYESAFICLLVLALFMLPFFIQQNFGIELPSTLEIIILLFIFAAEILGELKCYFITFSHWDSMLHTTTGFLCAATGFALIDILNRNSRIKFQLSPIYVALTAFCFSMTVGVLWEFFEFGMDRLFLMDMQKDTVVQSITSVMLDPTNKNIPVTIDGITSVTVNGQELAYRDSNLFLASDVLLTSMDDVVRMLTAQLYFPDADGTLTPEERLLPQYEGQSTADVVIAALMDGPTEDGLQALIPEEVTGITARVEDGVCQLNLPSEELDAVDADTVEQMLRGIVTSLRSLEGITAVQVYRDGTYVDVYE